MGEIDEAAAEHRQEFPDCAEPMEPTRCKCGNSRVYACGLHLMIYRFTPPSCTCVWV